MNLKQLPYYIAIAETGSLSAAARRTGVSQPAISGYLQELEQELGTPLFVRSRRRMQPTAAGQVYLDMARQVLALQVRTRTQIGARRSQKRQTIRLGLSPHRGAQALAALYPQFIKRYPQIELQPVESYVHDAISRLRQGSLELSFSTAVPDLAEPGLHYLPMQNEEIVLALPAFHRFAFFASRDVTAAPQLDLAEFRDIPFVLMSPDSTVGQVSQRLFACAGFEPVTVFRSDNVVMVNDMVRAGAGAALIPAYYARPLEEVVYFRLKQPGYLTFCAAWRAGRHLPEAERYLIYLKVKAYDEKNLRTLTDFIQTDELQSILQEFDPAAPAILPQKGPQP